MSHARTIVRTAALVSSFGLIGTYVACQQRQHGGTATPPRAPADVPATRPEQGPTPPPPQVLPGSKSAPAAFLDLLNGPGAGNWPFVAGDPSGPAPRRMLFPSSKSDSSTFVRAVTGTPGPLGHPGTPAVPAATVPAQPNP